jgi:ABC-2 type transport system ATP-binding protein
MSRIVDSPAPAEVPAVPTPVIECRKLSKIYRSPKRKPGARGFVSSLFRREHVELVALRDVDLVVGQGQFLGLIGANGAGKTTLVKCLTGIVPATGGEALLLGRDAFHLRDADKRRLSLVMGQRSQLWWDIPAIDSFRLLQEIYEVPDEDFHRRVRSHAERLDVTDKLEIQLRHLSLGQRMKMEIIGAFVHAPDVVFLDEPTIGLDLVSRETIRQFLREINRDTGATIVLTSHDMEDIEQTCERLVILDHGRVLFDGDLVALHRRLVERRAVEVHLQPGSTGFRPEMQPRLDAHHATLVREASLVLLFELPAENAQAFIRELFDLFEVRDLAVERQPLEQLIRQIFLSGEMAK